jgi:hypothetical protein
MDQSAIKKYRAELGMRAAMRSAHDNPELKAAKAIEEIPVRKLYEQAMYIENDLLPRIEKRSTNNSADYIFFKEVFKSLLWSIAILDRFDKVCRSDTQSRLMNELMRERCLLLEGELQKYITMEDLLLSDSIDRIADIVKKRIDSLLKDKP